MKITMQSNNNQRVKKYYVYGHYTEDTDVLFYIGVGTVLNPRIQKVRTKYGRAYNFSKRTKFWKNIKNKHGIVVKILHLFETKEESLEKERELIAKYGRRFFGGILCNLSSGGEVGPVGYSHPVSEETKKLLSDKKSMFFYVYDSEGNFIKECKTTKNTAKFCGVTYNAIHSCMKTQCFSNGFFIFRDFQGDSLGYTKEDLSFKSPLCKKVLTENILTKEILTHNSIYDCCKYLRTDRKNLKNAIKAQRPCKKHNVYFEGTISSQDPK